MIDSQQPLGVGHTAQVTLKVPFVDLHNVIFQISFRSFFAVYPCAMFVAMQRSGHAGWLLQLCVLGCGHTQSQLRAVHESRKPGNEHLRERRKGLSIQCVARYSRDSREHLGDAQYLFRLQYPLQYSLLHEASERRYWKALRKSKRGTAANPQ